MAGRAGTDAPSPVGLANGPGNLIYQASTIAGLVRVWEARPDHTLQEKDVIKVGAFDLD